MAALEYRITPLPAEWPGKRTPSYAIERSRFKTIWTRVLHDLEREVRHLDGKKVEFAIDVDARHLRQDGQLRADARPRSSGVVVSFSVGPDRLQFPCDRFAFWQDNVSAVARALEALRMVDRYGVQQGRQYQGFKALAAATAPTMDTQQAAMIIGAASGYARADIVAFPVVARNAVRVAASRTHPDRNAGASDDFALVQQARKVLEAHHGGAF